MARLPDLAEISGMSDAQIAALLRRLGADVDLADIGRAAAIALGQLTRADAPEAALIEATRKRLESAVRRALQRAAKRALRAQEQAALADEPLAWVAVMDERTCESCAARHDETHTREEWELLGLPGSDNLICDGNCRCILVEESLGRGAQPPSEEEIAARIEITGRLI